VDERRLLESSPPYLRELIVFAINTGLRCGDLLDLKWEEADIDERRLSLIMGKTRRRLEVPLNDTSGSDPRRKARGETRPTCFLQPGNGRPVSRPEGGLQDNPETRRSDRHHVAHTLRHTFASRLTRSGVDLVTVKELLGHSMINTTMRYAHSNHDTNARAVAKLPSSDKVVTQVLRRAKKPKVA
jgi:integrase